MKLITYYPAWEPEKTDRLQYDILTNIIYSFAIPTSDGGVFIDNPEFARKLVKEAHENNVKISVAVGGWSWKDIPLEPTFVEATKTDEKLCRLADAIVALCNEFNFDGVDMDWEHPRVADGSGKRYEALVLELEKRLHSEGKLLTAAVIGGVDANGDPGGIDTGGADVGNAAMAQSDAVLRAVDWINVMAYDGPGEHHSSYEYAVHSTNYWNKHRGMPAEKIVLGVPFYGKPGWGSYDAVLKKYPDKALTSDILPMEGGDCCYNGVPTLQRKIRFAKQEGLAGMMIWEASEDTLDKEKSLLSAMGKEIAAD